MTAFIGVGSNQGDRKARCDEAVKRLGNVPGVAVDGVSSWYETAPVGPVSQGDFINGAVRVVTTLSPRELLQACLEVERVMGRVRTVRWGPRSIDLDVLLYGDRVIDEPGLCVPHPEMTRRPFVLEPLAEIAPELLVPGDGHRVDELAVGLRTPAAERMAR